VTSFLVLFILATFIGLGVYAFFDDTLKPLFENLGNPAGPPPDTEWTGLIAGIAAVAGILLVGAVYSVIWAFYTARELSIFAAYTTLDRAHFRLDATGASLIWLVLGNLLLILFTLGVAIPFAQQRLIRYLCDRLSAEGTVNVNAIMQSREAVGRTGEGLADAFDVSWI
jgi:uncharacterized membrane protein YjgN (DUF898 family)